MEYGKVKSVAKVVVPRSEKLTKKTLDTMRSIAEIVGATLGPGGCPVLIERQDHGLPNLVTKDGVTVFKSLGFTDAIQHSIMESARDAAVRTVGEAGDGTTTATILAESIVRKTHEYIQKHPRVSKQRVVTTLEKCFTDDIEPFIRKVATPADVTKKAGKALLRSVAKVSANGDEPLADAVMECYRLVGDTGNVTIVEQSGPSEYKVERIEGFPIPMGYEESCAKFMGMFTNDAANGRAFLDRPLFVLYHGVLTEVQTMYNLLYRLQTAWQNIPGSQHHEESKPRLDSPNVVIVATGFSEAVLGTLAANMVEPQSVNVVPLLAPRSPVMNGELHFLEDLAAVTGGTVLDPMSKPMDGVSEDFSELGHADSFEMYRYRSTVVGHADPDEVAFYADSLEALIANAESEFDKRLLQERLGKVTGGIAKLKVVGSSNGELKEKRDRAEDAVLAVRGAMKHGCLPGGGWALLALAFMLASKEKEVKESIIDEVLVPALIEPLRKLFANVGMTEEEAAKVMAEMESDIVRFAGAKSLKAPKSAKVYDALEGRFVDAFEGGVLDSTPAVLEAVRSSLSIATLLGTLGGVVVFERDNELERRESTANNEFVRNANVNEANERW